MPPAGRLRLRSLPFPFRRLAGPRARDEERVEADVADYEDLQVRPIIGTKATALIVSAIDVAAPAMSLTWAMEIVSSVNATPSTSCGSPLGKPYRTSRPKRPQSK